MSGSGAVGGSAIRVALRIRPESASDENGHSDSCIAVTGDRSVQIARKRELTGQSEQEQYTFDHVFTASSTQEEVFGSVRDLINEALLGYNVTVFAFGMTGSGKTHTISGTHAQPGLVPRTVHHVFSSLRTHATAHKESVAMVFLTFVELYNNTLYDLLAGISGQSENNAMQANLHHSSHSHSHGHGHAHGHGHTTGDGGSLKIHEHPTRGIQLSGSSTIRTPVASAEEALNLISKGSRARATAATNLNERSSRSHTVITLEVVSRSPVPAGISASGASSVSTNAAAGGGPQGGVLTSFGKINLVDLAGSERVKVSGAEGQTLTEAKQINKALSVLGDVLNTLSRLGIHANGTGTGTGSGSGTNEAGLALAGAADGGLAASLTGTGAGPPSLSHVPYRNSKLTMLLKDSLGGNAKTMMIATVRPSLSFFPQVRFSDFPSLSCSLLCSPYCDCKFCS